MSYWIVVGACFAVGAIFGILLTVLVSINHNTEEYHTEEAGCDGRGY